LVNRWQESDRPRGADYDRRFEDLAATGMDMHGEVALVAEYAPTSVLDAGCGTGRVAIELSRRGYDVVGVDFDDGMLQEARRKAPDLTWLHGDLADPGLDLGGRTFDLVVMAGNVLIFVAPGTEGQVVENAARWLRPGGRLLTGYYIKPGPGAFGPGHLDELATGAGLALQDRWSTWDKTPFTPGDSYTVAVHMRAI
jgi:SAM-dependent methyltransferase